MISQGSVLSVPFWVISQAPTGVYSCIRTCTVEVGLSPSSTADSDVASSLSLLQLKKQVDMSELPLRNSVRRAACTRPAMTWLASAASTLRAASNHATAVYPSPVATPTRTPLWALYGPIRTLTGQATSELSVAPELPPSSPYVNNLNNPGSTQRGSKTSPHLRKCLAKPA